MIVERNEMKTEDQDKNDTSVNVLNEFPQVLIVARPDGKFDIKSNVPGYVWKGIIMEAYRIVTSNK